MAVLMAALPFIGATALAGEMTDVGTLRVETLICEPDDSVNPTPGQFNPYMTGTRQSWGAHQIMWVDGIWEVNTITGERIPTIAADLATPNEDYTEWTIKIREGLKWSDGETLDANDVAFTINMIMGNDKLTDSAYYNSLFEKVEVLDDLTLKVYCDNPFTRIMTTLGVNTWGCGFRVVPEHIYSTVDPATFPDSEPVTAGAYKLKDYDQLGTWTLYERREDWANTPTGMLYGEPGPKYVLYRVFGSQEARVMAMLNNEVDVMNEVAYEDLKLLLDGNPNVHAWYPEFPFATTDDACSKGIFFNTAIKPFDDVNVRWALTLACDWVEVSENVFEGIGRMSALQVPAVTAMQTFYYKPMSDWLANEFTIDGEYNPWNPNFSKELAERLTEDFGYDMSAYSDEELIDVFGVGYFKTDKEKAAELLTNAGLELKDGKWYYEGQPWVIPVIVHPEEESTQASRSGKAIADQWEKFGIATEITTIPGSDIGNRLPIGDFTTVDSWDACSAYSIDFYNNINGWNDEVYKFELGERGTGIANYRLPISNPELAAKLGTIVRDVAGMDPNSEETQAMLTEFLKLAFEAHINIMVHSGTKIVPFNETYWTGFPTSENPYEGPWWWWSNFRFTLPRIQPAQ
jgi:peptide/nickel transport system substrate-binding protein